MINNHMLAAEAAKRLSERAGHEITIDDLRQMRRHGHIEGTRLSYNVVVFTPEQVESATIPPERQPTKRKRKARRKVKTRSA